jgi:predicted metal-dependent peptidase
MNAPATIAQQAAHAVAVARLKMTQRASAGLLSEIGFGLDHKATDEIPTLATDGKACLYNPAFVLQLSDDALQTALAHEYAHAALLHPVRRRPHHDPEVANIAMDHAVNLLLREAGFTVPTKWYADHRYQGMSWEHIYTLLIQDAPPPQASPDAGPECEPFDVSPGQPGDVQDDVLPYPGKNGQPASDAELSAAEADMTDRVLRVAQAMAQAGRGTNLGQRLLDKVTTPRDPDLYEALARLLERSPNDHTWRRINRRLLHAGLFPGLDGEECPPLVIAVDTSGSISDRILGAFEDKIRRAIADFKPRAVTIIYCDSQINEDPQTYDPSAFPGLHPVGGGGTSFAPPFEWVAEHMAEAPAALVYLTDLEGSAPAHPPGYPVIWAAIPTYRALTAPWGETVRIQL